MSLFELGNLYRVKQNSWLLFPDKLTAASRGPAHPLVVAQIQRWSTSPRRACVVTGQRPHALASPAKLVAEYWSKQLQCSVTFLSAGAIFMVIATDGRAHHVAGMEGIGWINAHDDRWTRPYFEKVG